MGFRWPVNGRTTDLCIRRWVKGALNKQAAAELGVSEMTVKVHRHNIMHKMDVATLPDLVRMMERLNAASSTRQQDKS